MVKKGEKSQGKAETIREYMKANPSAGPQAVSAALKEMGIECSPAYVSTIKSLAKKRGRKPARKERAAETRTTSGGLTIESLVQAKKLVAALGGVAQAKSALDALAKLGL